jgi:hypothetical protein
MTIHDAAITRLSQYWRRAIRSGFGYAQAWRTTRRRPQPLYARELLRAVVWTLLPVLAALVAGLAVHPVLLLLAPLVYAAQIARIALRLGPGDRLAWQRAALLTLGKFAEIWGALRYVRRAASGQAGGTIAYK